VRALFDTLRYRLPKPRVKIGQAGFGRVRTGRSRGNH